MGPRVLINGIWYKVLSSIGLGNNVLDDARADKAKELAQEYVRGFQRPAFIRFMLAVAANGQRFPVGQFRKFVFACGVRVSAGWAS